MLVLLGPGLLLVVQFKLMLFNTGVRVGREGGLVTAASTVCGGGRVAVTDVMFSVCVFMGIVPGVVPKVMGPAVVPLELVPLLMLPRDGPKLSPPVLLLPVENVVAPVVMVTEDVPPTMGVVCQEENVKALVEGVGFAGWLVRLGGGSTL